MTLSANVPLNPVIGEQYDISGSLTVEWDGTKFFAVSPPIPSNGLTRHFDSLATLQLNAGRYDGDTCILAGYYAGSNVGGGNSVWDATSTATPAGAVIVQVTGVPVGRWLMQLDGFVTPEIFGSNGTASVDYTAILAGLNYSAATGLQLQGVEGTTYVINDDYVLTDAVNVNFEGCTIEQTVNGKGFLQLRADGNTAINIHAVYNGTRTLISGSVRYRGYSAWQRMCAVWCESGNNIIQNITSENMNNTLCLRGPVVFNPAGAGYTGNDTDPNTAFFYTALADDNDVSEIHGVDQDFAVTGHQQRRLKLKGFSGRNITNVQGVPPHAIYMTNGSTGYCEDCSIDDMDCDTNIYGVAHKFINFNNTVFHNVRANNSTGVLLLDSCNNVQGSDLFCPNLSARDEAEDDGRWAIYLNDSNGVFDNAQVTGGDDVAAAGVVALGATNFTVNNIHFTSNWPASVGTAAPIRAEGTSVLRVKGIHHRRLGVDAKELVVTNGTATAIVSDISTEGTTKVALAGAGTLLHVMYDEKQIDGFDYDSAFSGTVTKSQINQSSKDNIGSTITIYGTTSAGGHTYSSRNGQALRKGSEVTVYARLVVSGTFLGTGEVRVGPLPYLPLAGASVPDVSVPIATSVNITLGAGEQLYGTIRAGEQYIRLQAVNGTAKTNVAAAAIGSNARIDFQITYRVS